MADNYNDMTGIIRAEKITPVIEALFSCYNLDPKYPGTDEFYIGTGDYMFGHYPTWGNLVVGLVKLCKERGVTSEAKEDFAEETVGILEALFNSFAPIDLVKAKAWLDRAAKADELDDVELQDLFELAQLLDDGHGLQYYHVEGAYTCSKPRLGEFGGYGYFRSNHVAVQRSSYSAEVLGRSMHECLVNGQIAEAGVLIGDQTHQLLQGIQDEGIRHQVARATVDWLNLAYDPLQHITRQAPSPSNDPPSEFDQRRFNAARGLFG